MSRVWINGRLAEKSAASVNVFDHGLLYGDGVWTDLRAFQGQLFEAEAAFRQLFQSAAGLGIDIPLSLDALQAAVMETLRANDRTDGYIRILVTRGPGTIGPDPRRLDAQLIIVAEEYHPFPLELYEHGLDVISVRLPATDRHRLGNPNTVIAKRAALAAGCLEAILVDEAGRVTGATEGEIVLVRDGRMFATSPPMMWDHAVTIEPLTLNDLLAADEVFVAGTACGVIAITNIDLKPIGAGREGPVTKRVRNRYRKLTRSET